MISKKGENQRPMLEKDTHIRSHCYSILTENMGASSSRSPAIGRIRYFLVLFKNEVLIRVVEEIPEKGIDSEYR